ncbi:MAG: DUF5702 domain-containing protein [Butyrivibrio sp.]|nr:DUF5702 domain-containing protein [Acetatifactor muris]MCM1559511.1 DUF5702 domain-containing protein [Butyrivibrio sp.]
MRRGNAYLTVYLALCLTLILSLYLALIDGARRGGSAMESACAAEMGMQNIMAEYHRELLNRFNLFAIDSSYGTDVCGRKNTEAHLMGYLQKNLSTDGVLDQYIYRDFLGLRAEDAELTGVSILTDEGGAVFRSMAIDAVKSDVGLSLLEEVQEWMSVVEVNGLGEADYDAESLKLNETLEEYNGKEVQISETESICLEVENPAAQLNVKRGLGILQLVTENTHDLSGKAIDGTTLAGYRMRQGNVNVGNRKADPADSLWERVLFQEYLLRYLGRYGNEKADGALDYQLEYLIAGKNYDTDNLKSVANRLSALREAANVIYLLTDAEKSAEIHEAAILACGLFALPELIPLLEAAILFGWAYAESVYDVKTLLAGGKIPLIKDRSSWHYALENALWGNIDDAPEEGNGLSYEDYLRILMLMTDLDTLTARAMDMVEADIRLTPGNARFRLDGCYAEVEAVMRISSSFGYKFELRRERTYR